MTSHTNAANNYRRLRRLASLCSEASGSDADGKARKQLAVILTRSVSGEFESYSDLLLLTLLEERLELDAAQLRSLAQALHSEQVSEEERFDIARLGDVLYQETAQALSRLRSG